MMKLKTKKLFIVMIALFTSCTGQKEITDMDTFNLTGPVKTVNAKVYKAKKMFGDWTMGEIVNDPNFVWMEPSPYNSAITSFDEHGLIKTRTTYGYFTDIKYLTKYKYNTKSKLIRTEKYYLEGFNKGELSDSVSYKYDKNGKNIEEQNYNSDGEKQWGIKRKWNGDELQTLALYSEDSLTSEDTYKDYTLNGTYTWVHKSDNKLTKGKTVTKNGRWTDSWSYSEDGTLMFHNVCYRNDKELTTKWTLHHISGEKITWVFTNYKFDSKQNWISVDVIKDGEPYIIKREIDYYD